MCQNRGTPKVSLLFSFPDEKGTNFKKRTQNNQKVEKNAKPMFSLEVFVPNESRIDQAPKNCSPVAANLCERLLEASATKVGAVQWIAGPAQSYLHGYWHGF